MAYNREVDSPVSPQESRLLVGIFLIRELEGPADLQSAPGDLSLTPRPPLQGPRLKHRGIEYKYIENC